MNRRKRIKLALLLILLVGAVAMFCPIKVTIGRTKVTKSLVKMDMEESAIPQGFSHVSADGPTGSFYQADSYAFRMGNWLWRFEIERGQLVSKKSY